MNTYNEFLLNPSKKGKAKYLLALIKKHGFNGYKLSNEAVVLEVMASDGAIIEECHESEYSLMTAMGF